MNFLDFDKCYQVYRGIVCEFNPAPLAEVPGPVELLAIGEMEGWQHNGIGFFDLWARGKNPRYARQVRSKIGKIMLRHSTINWAALLPEASPPTPVEVEPKSRL